VDDASVYALLTYLAQMAPPPDARSAPDARAARGKKIFDSYDTGCRDCHDPSHGLSDGERHDVGSKAKGDVRASFETPSLRFVGGTAPYFHDGRFPTLEALLRGSPRMADTSHLSQGELDDLAAYLETL
jgi:cytochrome c peroxidase